jgi:hypothetical protein
MFTCCSSDSDLYGVLDKSYITSVSQNENASSLHLTVEFPSPPAPVVLGLIEAGIAAEKNLTAVKILPVIAAVKGGKNNKSSDLSGSEGKMLVGKAIRDSASHFRLVPESGRVDVTGEGFGRRNSREVRGNAKIAGVNITALPSALKSPSLCADRGCRLRKNQGRDVSVRSGHVT